MSAGPRDVLRRGLELEIPYYSQSLPTTGREAAVLALFAFPEGSGRQDLREASLLLTRRTEHVDTHKGQIALPGGHRDPEDPDERHVALREMEEEVGISRTQVDVVGQLPVLWTRTGFLVTPVLGMLETAIERTELRVSASEIAEVFWAPVDLLLSPQTYSQQEVELAGHHYAIHSYQVGRHRVWGVTGSIIKNILDRIVSVT